MHMRRIAMGWVMEKIRPTLHQQHRSMLGQRRYAPMGTLEFTPIVAHPMGTTGLSFSLTACLSVRVRGTGADSMAAVDSMAIADLTGAADLTVAVDSTVADLPVGGDCTGAGGLNV